MIKKVSKKLLQSNIEPCNLIVNSAFTSSSRTRKEPDYRRHAASQPTETENPISGDEDRAAPPNGRPAHHADGVSAVRLAAYQSFVEKEKAAP